jgi:dihydrofolate reductase
MLRLIAAVDSALGVANDQGIPWQGKIPKDVQHFRSLTADGIIVMGYGTYQELASPFHDRVNFVVARPDSGDLRPGFEVITDMTSFLRQNKKEIIWVIGGAALFTKTLVEAHQLCLTRLDRNFHCTKFFPTFTQDFVLSEEDGPNVENGITFRFETWNRALPIHELPAH